MKAELSSICSGHSGLFRGCAGKWDTFVKSILEADVGIGGCASTI
jgi:hypothetical protein